MKAGGKVAALTKAIIAVRCSAMEVVATEQTASRMATNKVNSVPLAVGIIRLGPLAHVAPARVDWTRKSVFQPAIFCDAGAAC